MADLRAMTPDDVDEVAAVVEDSFGEYEERFHEPREDWTPQRLGWFAARTRMFLEHDPAGAYVAVEAGRLVGATLACVTDGLWALSLLAVRPEAQSGGTGRALMQAALTTCGARGAISSSRDVRALRTYALNGFAPYPYLELTGRVRTAPARAARVRDGVDPGFAADVDRVVRGASHGPYLQLLEDRGARGLTVEDGGDRGYAYLGGEGHVYLLAATSERTAATLLEAALRELADAETVTVGHVTGAQQWAMTAALTAGLHAKLNGAVCWRGMAEPRAYLPNGALL